MHILFLTDNFPPETNAPARRTHGHTKVWATGSNKVTVLTCAPNFPAGKLYSGYQNKLWQKEVIDGVSVIRVWTYMAANQGTFRRSLDFLSFMISAIIAGFFVRKVDVIVATSQQFFTACAGYCLATMKSVPWVFELRDLWPASIRAVGALNESFFLRALSYIEMYLYKKSSLIVPVTESFKQILIDRGIPPSKIEVIKNGASRQEFYPRPKDQDLQKAFGLRGKFVVGYVGTLGLAHGLETLIFAARDLQSNPATKNVRLMMIGDGAQRLELESLASASGLTNLVFARAAEGPEVPRFWSVLDLSIAHLKNDETFDAVIPSKIFEAAAMGIPTLLGVKGEAKVMIERAGIGRSFTSEDHQSLAVEIEKLATSETSLQKLKNNCAAFSRENDREIRAKEMLSKISNLKKSLN